MLRTAIVLGCVAACSKSDPPAKSSPATSPAPALAAPRSDASSCSVAIVIDAMGATIATAAGSCRAPRIHGQLDVPWFEAELGSLRWAMPDCAVDALVVAETGPYHELINVMDIAMKEGIGDVNVGDKSDVKFATDSASGLHCKQPAPPPKKPAPTRETAVARPSNSIASTIARPLPRPPTPEQVARVLEFRSLPMPAPTTKSDLLRAPVIVVTKTEVTFQGKVLASVDAVAKDANALKPLADVLRASADVTSRDHAAGRLPPDLMKACEEAAHGSRPEPGAMCPLGLAILQADELTDMRVINAVLHTATSQGFDNLLFAVRNK